MSPSLKNFALSTVLAASLNGYADTASASPAMDRLAFKNSSSSVIEPVQWRGWGWGPAVAGGLVAGALVGSALAAPYYYGAGPYYPYYPGPYYAPAPAGYYAPGYGPAQGGDAADYCLQRYRSYNPRTGTYLGTDGYSHPCP